MTWNALTITAVLIVFSMILALVVALYANLTRQSGGRLLAFLALFILPGISMWAAFSQHMQSSETTSFCLSCHVMRPFGQSLLINDKSFIPATHFQNNRVPRDQACFTCHTDYTMFGDYQAKLRGLRHVWVEYFGHVPQPAKIKLYTPYNNRECLHCHADARSYIDAPEHNKKPEMLRSINDNRLSCISSGCHEFVHDIADLKENPMWKQAPASDMHLLHYTPPAPAAKTGGQK